MSGVIQLGKIYRVTAKQALNAIINPGKNCRVAEIFRPGRSDGHKRKRRRVVSLPGAPAHKYASI
ncbi:hypothetical protein GCM10011587_07530 [Pyruvatibacter mobilis]|nr:hypothetical protein GCM10011587_07530 [Pyruvatibacter mobilis]